MAKRQTFVSLAALSLDKASSVPMHQQLYNRLRSAILSRQLIGGTRLPSTRALAEELNISRSTVLNAFEQLLAEGYIEGKTGAGTYVAKALPDDMLAVPNSPVNGHKPKSQIMSQPGALMAATLTTLTQVRGAPGAFRTGMPAIDAFPLDIWARLAAQRWKHPPRELLVYGDPAGYRPLREAISGYLGAARGVQCQPEQVIVVAGSQQALDLAARLLLAPGDAAVIEDPGYLGARGALLNAGARLVAVPVDKEGLDVAMGIERAPDARLVYVSPSHQYPMGATLSLSRRLALLEWASRNGAWVLEDDYDSEYRYAGRPLAAMQGLDKEGRVIYMGTFSKVLFPSLRLGYLVVPNNLVEAFIAARAVADRHSPIMEQAILTDFIEQGHFARHIRRMRSLYAERQNLLLTAAQRELDGLLELAPAEAGMHLLGWLPQGVDDKQAAKLASIHGVETPPLSLYAVEPPERGGLLLGYAGVEEQEINRGVRALAQALKEILRKLSQ